MTSTSLVLLLPGLLVSQSGAQNQANAVRVLSAEGVTLLDGWRFQQGDNPLRANADFPNQSWPIIKLPREINNLSSLNSASIGWLQLRF